MSDTRFRARGQPAIIYGLRGGLGLELNVAGPAHDLHGGSFGGAIHNPLQALSEIIARLHDAQGRVAIPGFYDSVRRVAEAERAYLRRVAPPDATILRDAQTEHGWGERGYSLYERTTIRPALTINGVRGGYNGPGGKAIIPAHASAKLSFRLVPDQNPRAIEQLLRRHIARTTPPTVRASLQTRLMARPALLDPHHPAIMAAASAYRRGFGAAPVLLRSGGTIPIVNMLRETFNVPVVLMGFALPDDRMHAPNEKFDLRQFFGAIETCISFLFEISRLSAAAGRSVAVADVRSTVT
jgi:acetylornithine deacetylase/succinyl-diaminopimelate desuccinylase-like protein